MTRRPTFDPSRPTGSPSDGAARGAAATQRDVTSTVTPAIVGLDCDAVAQWLEGCGLGLSLPLRFELVGRGRSNLTYLVTDSAGMRIILRRPPVGRLLPSAHDVAREHRILRALESTAVPTPAVLGFTDERAVTPVPLLALEYVEGIVVDEPRIAEALTCGARHRIGLELAAALAPIHGLDLEAAGLSNLSGPKPYAARQLKRWRRQWEESCTRELAAVSELADRLEAAMPEQREVTLVHGDFHLLNVVAAPDGRAIRAVLDWELCTLGDPLADIGGLLAYWPEPTDAAAPVFPAAALPGFPTRRELAERYAAETGRSQAELGFWHALGLWKIAIITEGVRRRVLDGAAGAARRGVLPAHIVDDLIARARIVAADAGL
jgi:aminoglycoside phosphotransferase (APT) family kinase protein